MSKKYIESDSDHRDFALCTKPRWGEGVYYIYRYSV